ncbi:hypothetical protein AcW1_000668 [Taiwanofungus camphoratus]|nr:hypothetical protein AcW1_000668 [Antrodia cinnamomea]
MRIKKRIIVCCDGTWQDGTVVGERWKYTNVLRLARAVNHIDERFDPPIPQIVFYQSGVGASNSIYDQIVDGATGASLGEKVEEAYAFIAHNFAPGDEIFLFGFSRGAYTARTVAAFIGEIGVLDRTDMDHFAAIFLAFQKRGKTSDEDEIKALDKQLAPWTHHDSPGKKRADLGPDSFSVKCIGVFDTVGSVGLPEELTHRSEKIKSIFGFRDKLLGEHIARAYQALALNERRADFGCNKFEQTEEGRMKKQVLKQCWFAGCHSDIGGGYQERDLADLTLAWMAANVGDALSLNQKYIAALPVPVQPWGELVPHNSLVGIFSLAQTIQRKIPSATDNITHETIHPSVLRQKILLPELANNLKKNPGLVCQLLPLEEELKFHWHIGSNATKLPQQSLSGIGHDADPSLLVTEGVSKEVKVSVTLHSKDGDLNHKDWLSCSVEETSMSALVKEILG